MRPRGVSPSDLKTYFQSKGLASTQEIADRFRVSPATARRLVTDLSLPLVRIGSTNKSRYGLLKPLPGLGAELPLFRVSEVGRLEAAGNFQILHAQNYVLQPEGTAHSGLPPEIADMRPQGFLGRSFSGRFGPELGLPARLDDWSNDHILVALARRGEDLPGNLILGQESAQRWRDREVRPARRDDYRDRIDASLAGQPAGSSAGGDQPKFTAIVDGKHLIVKFAGLDSSAAQMRWHDLLICEHLALQHLKSAGFSAAETELHFDGDLVFLEVERFDRVGTGGRKAVVTLAAIADYWIGARETWSATSVELERLRQISPEDARRLRLLDLFGACIADSDRHYHNVAFFPEASAMYRLAPAFDKLPMYFAPVSGQVRKRAFMSPIPDARQMDVWQEARHLAAGFWARVIADARISGEFRKIAEGCKAVLR